MKRNKQFSVEEHEQFAAELCRMRLIAMQYAVKTGQPKGSQQARRLLKLQRVIDSLRSEMDNLFYRDYPQKEYRKPHREWVHTPYYNPELEKRIINQVSVGSKEQEGLQ